MIHSGNGALVISLDFELFWGVKDRRTQGDYGENILGARKVIPAMLDLFSTHQIHCTWATVGFLFHATKEELLNSFPEVVKPEYSNPALSNYTTIGLVGNDEVSDPFHFGESLIRLIKNTPGQEVGTHTYSHFYCLEKGPSLEAFRSDMAKALEVSIKKGCKVVSLVFPRNQYSIEHIRVASELGIKIFRGTEENWIYSSKSRMEESLFRRFLRLLDSYFNLTGHHISTPKETLPGIFDIPSSRFLRPYNSRLFFLESLKLNRIKKSMEMAAKRGKVFHLWWHPHNFGKNCKENLQQLEEILRHFKYLKNNYNMQSLNMSEVVSNYHNYE